MITSRPQTTSTASFILFLVIGYTVLVINVLAIQRDPEPGWITYLVAWLLTPICLFVTYKVISRYKIVTLGNGQITVYYPILATRRNYALKDLKYWTESIVKTGKTSSYREVEIKFTDDRIIQMGQREFTSYEQILQYLSQKAAKLRKANP